MFNCNLVPCYPNDPASGKNLSNTSSLHHLLTSWSKGYFTFVPTIFDRHDKLVYKLHANQAAAWQQAITEAAEQFSLPKLFCTQDTALHVPVVKEPFAVVQEIQLTLDDMARIWSNDGQSKTSRLFFFGITQRLNACFEYWLQQGATKLEVSKSKLYEEMLSLLAKPTQPMVLIGSAQALLSLGIGSTFMTKEYVAPKYNLMHQSHDSEPRGNNACQYSLGVLDMYPAKFPTSVICTGSHNIAPEAVGESYRIGDSIMNTPNDTVYLVPAALGHFSCSDVFYASSWRSMHTTPESDGCAWMLAEPQENKLWLSASQEFSLDVYEDRKRWQIKIVD